MKVQKTLSHREIKNNKKNTLEELATVYQLYGNSWDRFKTYLCLKHKQTFVRHEHKHYGMCWYCKNRLKPSGIVYVMDIDGTHPIRTYELQEYHTSNIEEIEKYFDSLDKEGDDMKVKRSITIDDGKYNGVIKDVVEKKEPYEYTDFVIEYDINGEKVELKYGCPSAISLDKDDNPSTKLAQALTNLGMKIEVDKDLTNDDIKKFAVGLKVTSLIANKPSKNKEGQTINYANVTTLTLKK